MDDWRPPRGRQFVVCSSCPSQRSAKQAAATALSVAQTQVPSAGLPFISVTGVNTTADFPAVFQPWSTPPTEVITADVVHGDGAGGNLNGCARFTTDLPGPAVLVDRGACNVTLEAENVQDAGGVVAIIGLVAPGAPYPGGDGGDGPTTIPSYMISQLANSLVLQGTIAAGATSITLDPACAADRQRRRSSSRGPQFDDQRTEPEIGAPGASVSAVAGSGDGTGAFGGTSGAAPTVAGSAALLVEATGGSKSPARAGPRAST